jgi:hypothetical protein
MSAPNDDEAMAIIRRIGPVAMSAAVDLSGASGTALRRMCGMMVVDYNMLHQATFATVFAMILDLTRQCAATLVTTERIRLAALAETPESLLATQTVLTIVRLTLASQARILGAMTFASRDEVETLAMALNDAFWQTEEIASDDLDTQTYIALISLHGDVTKHLADQGRFLPRVILYSYQMVMPSLRMAQLVYADPTRSDELIAENAVVHPAFMPMTGKMLAT